MTDSHYTMNIRWSEEDDTFVVSLPEWRERVINPVTHGMTYEEAAANGQEAIELLIESILEQGESLPAFEPVAGHR